MLKNDIPVIKLRWASWALAIVLLGAGVASLVLFGGFNLGVDFESGLSQRIQIAPTGLEVTYDGNLDTVVSISTNALSVEQRGEGGVATKTLRFSEYPTSGDLATALDSVDGVSTRVIDGALSSSDILSGYGFPATPKFDETIKNYKQVIEVIQSQIKIIKKHKLKILIKMNDGHAPKMYRYILEALNDKQVSIIFDYIYLYGLNESHVTAYRLLRNYIDLLIMDDIDQLGSGRVLGSGGHIDVTGIAKRFIKRKYEGFVVLDSSLVDLLYGANNQGWFSKLVSKKTKHDIKIYEDFVERYRSTDMYRVLRLQMAILSIMFLNKKIALG